MDEKKTKKNVFLIEAGGLTSTLLGACEHLSICNLML